MSPSLRLSRYPQPPRKQGGCNACVVRSACTRFMPKTAGVPPCPVSEVGLEKNNCDSTAVYAARAPVSPTASLPQGTKLHRPTVSFRLREAALQKRAPFPDLGRSTQRRTRIRRKDSGSPPAPLLSTARRRHRTDGRSAAPRPAPRQKIPSARPQPQAPGLPPPGRFPAALRSLPTRPQCRSARLLGAGREAAAGGALRSRPGPEEPPGRRATGPRGGAELGGGFG